MYPAQEPGDRNQDDSYLSPLRVSRERETAKVSLKLELERVGCRRKKCNGIEAISWALVSFIFRRKFCLFQNVVESREQIRRKLFLFPLEGRPPS